MKTVVVVLSTVASAQAAGTAAQGGIVFALSNGAPSQMIAAAPYSASFVDVAPGTYTATAQAVDVNGVAVGELKTSAPFTIEDDSVPYNLPDTLTVNIS
jgi:hypothetical protein